MFIPKILLPLRDVPLRRSENVFNGVTCQTYAHTLVGEIFVFKIKVGYIFSIWVHTFPVTNPLGYIFSLWAKKFYFHTFFGYTFSVRIHKIYMHSSFRLHRFIWVHEFIWAHILFGYTNVFGYSTHILFGVHKFISKQKCGLHLFCLGIPFMNWCTYFI